MSHLYCRPSRTGMPRLGSRTSPKGRLRRHRRQLRVAGGRPRSAGVSASWCSLDLPRPVQPVNWTLGSRCQEMSLPAVSCLILLRLRRINEEICRNILIFVTEKAERSEEVLLSKVATVSMSFNPWS